MQIIPPRPQDTKSKAEIKIFDALYEVFPNDNNYTAFHSLNLTRHEQKRFGEADFVVLCKFGLFVFEVKGGPVAVDDGVWHSIDKKGNRCNLQNPFRQAEGAMHAICKSIKEQPELSKIKLPIGFGVIVPEVHWTVKSVEWDPLTICDGKTIRDLETWLKNFFMYWHRKNYKKTINEEDVVKIKDFLRPHFELIEPLFLKIDDAHSSLVKLTKDQYKYLDIAIANKRVLCSGGAGTGKTFLASELARRVAKENNIVGFICKSNWLRRYLETKINNQFIVVSTIESIALDMRRKGIESFNTIIVDEGQDVFGLTDLDILDDILIDGLKDGNWYMFHDCNNQAGLFGDSFDKGLELLKTYQPTCIPLTTNCRNTSNIIAKICNDLHVEMGVNGLANGPEVREVLAQGESSLCLEKEIKSLLQDGISPSAITILSPLEYGKSSVANLNENLKSNIVELDDYSVRSFPLSEITFSTIRNFKGLENDVIILVDLPKLEGDSKDKVQYYVAMTRARALLSVVWG